MIVAQHTFGIPCDIVSIRKLCDETGIFLLEDCALSLGSGFNGQKLGTFGDAALFSTDHSKPINTLAGGLVYSENLELIRLLKTRQSALPELPARKQKAMWKRMQYEALISRPWILAFAVLGEAITSKIFSSSRKDIPYITDGDLENTNDFDAYPAKMPAFLAEIGSQEVMRWSEVEIRLRMNLKETISFLRSNGNIVVPDCYSNPEFDIVPLRFITHQAEGFQIRKRLSRVLKVNWTWFMEPIIATSKPLNYFGYVPGSCQFSEAIGQNLVQLPLSLNEKNQQLLLRELSKALKSTPK